MKPNPTVDVGVLSSLLADIRGLTPGGPTPTEHADDSKIWSLRVLLKGSLRPGPRDGGAPCSAWWHEGTCSPSYIRSTGLGQVLKF